MLRASGNNESKTVEALFLTAVDEYGKPSRVRGDRGGENVGVAVWMIKHSGADRASFMWGRSVCHAISIDASALHAKPDFLAQHATHVSSVSGLRWAPSSLAAGEPSSSASRTATVLILVRQGTCGYFTSSSWLLSTTIATNSASNGIIILYPVAGRISLLW